MPYTKKIVCFANSRKYGSYCVAGKELEGSSVGDWIRPVSSGSKEGELTCSDIIYADTTMPKLLDIILMTFSRHLPSSYQTENHLIDRCAMWTKITSLDESSVHHFLDSPETLWLNGYNTSRGINDRLPFNEACMYKRSLFLIEPEKAYIAVNFEEMRKRVRAYFRYNGTEYKLIITDPEFEHQFTKEGEFLPSDKIYFCISLSIPFVDNFCYKLIAGVVTREKFTSPCLY